MPEYIDNFSQLHLDLIVDNEETAVYNFDETTGDYVRLKIKPKNASGHLGLFYSNRKIDGSAMLPGDYDNPAIQPQIKIYRDDASNIFIKPNEIFENSYLVNQRNLISGHYTLEFDFLRDVVTDLGYPITWEIAEISNSRKEIRLEPKIGVDYFDITLIENSFTNALSEDAGYAFDWVCVANNVNIPITNYVFDFQSDRPRASLILRLYTPLPQVYSQYSTVTIEKEKITTQSDDIFYKSDDILVTEYAELTPDTGFSTMTNNSELGDDSFQSQNDISSSTSNQNLLQMALSSSKNPNLKIDFREFKNHTFFGSAEQKLKNFYTKVKSIEDKFTEISSSLNTSHTPNTGSLNYDLDELNNRALNPVFGDFTEVNSNFDTFASWSNTTADPAEGTIKRDETYAYSGSHSVKITAGTLKPEFRSDAWSVTPGHHYHLSYFAQGDSTNQIQHKVYDSTNGAAIVNWVDSRLINISWGKVQVPFTVPDDCTELKVYFRPNNTGGAYGLVDNVQLKEIFYDVTAPPISNRRKTLFKEIREIENDFTPYEKWLYTDGQTTSIFSAPGLGKNLTSRYPLDRDYSRTNYVELSSSFDGFDEPVYYTSASNQNSGAHGIRGLNSEINLFKHKNLVENSPYWNTSGSMYLSFLVRADMGEDATTNFIMSQSNPEGTTPIPSDAWSGRWIQSSSLDAGKYKHFVAVASQSWWRPVKTGPIYGDANKILDQHAGMSNSDYWEILSGSNIPSASYSGSIGDGYAYGIEDGGGSYGELMYPVSYSLDGLTAESGMRTGSIMPSGDLFPIYWTTSSIAQSVSSSYITNVRITQNNPVDVLPFAQVQRTGSSGFSSWYTGMLNSASIYDTNNIHSLVNNLPRKIREDKNSGILKLFINLQGEHYDSLRNHIDNYSNFNKRGYSDYESPPNNLLPIIGDNLGWEFINPYTSSLDSYFQYVSSGGENLENVTHHTWRKILNNLVYIYKSKGTLNSLRAVLNTYGFPPDLLPLQEYGTFSTENQNFTAENFNRSAHQGVYNHTDSNLTATRWNDKNYQPQLGVTGNQEVVTRNRTLSRFYSLSLKDYSIGLDWGTNNMSSESFVMSQRNVSSAAGNADKKETLEFMWKPVPSFITQSLLINSGSGTNRLWELLFIPSASNNSERGKFQYRIAKTSLAGVSIGQITNKLTMETPVVNISGNHLWNIMLRRTAQPTLTNSGSFDLHTIQQRNGQILNYQTTSMNFTESVVNTNWLSTGSRPSNTTGNLMFGKTFWVSKPKYAQSGSFSEIRVWKEALSTSSFVMHAMNPRSVVGNTVSSSINDLVYRYPLQENTTYKHLNPKINDVVHPSKYTKDLNPDTNRRNYYTFTDIIIPQFTMTRNSFQSVDSDSKVVINQSKEVIRKKGGLSHKNPSFRTIQSKFNQRIKNTSEVSMLRSPTEIIDNFILNNIANFNLGDYIGNPAEKYERQYKDLIGLNTDLLKDVSVDINKYIRAQKNIFTPSIINNVKKILPSRATTNKIGIGIKNHILHRNKIHNPTVSNEGDIVMNMNFEVKPIYSGEYEKLNLVTNDIQFTNDVYNFTEAQVEPILESNMRTVHFSGEKNVINLDNLLVIEDTISPIDNDLYKLTPSVQEIFTKEMRLIEDEKVNTIDDVIIFKTLESEITAKYITPSTETSDLTALIDENQYDINLLDVYNKNDVYELSADNYLLNNGNIDVDRIFTGASLNNLEATSSITPRQIIGSDFNPFYGSITVNPDFYNNTLEAVLEGEYGIISSSNSYTTTAETLNLNTEEISVTSIWTEVLLTDLSSSINYIEDLEIEEISADEILNGLTDEIKGNYNTLTSSLSTDFNIVFEYDKEDFPEKIQPGIYLTYEGLISQRNKDFDLNNITGSLIIPHSALVSGYYDTFVGGNRSLFENFDEWGAGYNDRHYVSWNQVYSETPDTGKLKRTSQTGTAKSWTEYDYNHSSYNPKECVVYTIGDCELISHSQHPHGVSNTNYNHQKHFKQLWIESEETYKPLILGETQTIKATPMGTTAYYATKSDGSLVYPSNHWIKQNKSYGDTLRDNRQSFVSHPTNKKYITGSGLRRPGHHPWRGDGRTDLTASAFYNVKVEDKRRLKVENKR